MFNILHTKLNSKYGRIEIEKYSMASNQVNFSPAKFRQLRIPRYSKDLNNVIEKLTYKSFENLRNSKQAYGQAENILFQEIGLQDFAPNKEPINIKNFKDSFATSGRLDAEYYQPKYEDYENLILNQQHTFIKNEYIHIKTKSKKDKIGYNYIEIGNVNVSDGSNKSNYVLTKDLPANAKNLVERGDILISNVRPYRGAVTIVNSDKENLIASGAFTVLRKDKSSIFNNEVLKVLLRSKVYKDWLLKFNVGTSYPVIKDADVLNLPIPFVKKEKQQQIADLIEKSFSLKKQSEHLLVVAKKAVEIAIEENEEIALNFINSQKV